MSSTEFDKTESSLISRWLINPDLIAQGFEEFSDPRGRFLDSNELTPHERDVVDKSSWFYERGEPWITVDLTRGSAFLRGYLLGAQLDVENHNVIVAKWNERVKNK